MSNNAGATALEAQYAIALSNIGITVGGFIHQENTFTRSALGRIIYRLYPYHYWNPVNQYLLELANEFKPDILVIFKGMDVYPETLQILKDKGIKLVNYNPDHPFIYVSRGSGNQNVFDSIMLYDLHITYSSNIAASFKEKFPHKKIEVIPFGFNLSDEEYYQFAGDEEVLRACFVGHADQDRAKIIKVILDQNLETDVYGPGWSRYFSTSLPRLRIFPALNGLEYYKTLHKYRVQLNLFRGHNENSHNMRSFEVPAAGGIMLAPDTRDHRRFFASESEVFLYNSLKDIPGMIDKILQLPESAASTIREHARKRSVLSGYDYKSRAVELLNLLYQL